MDLQELNKSLFHLWPEVILALTVCTILFADMFLNVIWSRIACGGIAFLGTFLSLAVLLTYSFVPGAAQAAFPFANTIIPDKLAFVFDLIILAGTLVTIGFSLRSRTLRGYRQGEYYSLLLGAAFGAMLLAAANNLILFALALETLSLSSYVLAGSAKHDKLGAEASLKYLLYGSVASGIMLFGFSYAYGLTGTLQIDECSTSLANLIADGRELFAVGVTAVLVMAGIGFKIAMVPFQFWSPDVYEGSPTPVTAFLSVVSKAAGFSALLRLAAPVLQSNDLSLFFFAQARLNGVQLLFGLFAALTMTFGNLAALKQTNIKRLFAYSSIAHAGYLLMAFSVFSPAAVEAMLVYLLIYFFMNFAVFSVIVSLENITGKADLDSYRGIAYQAPFLFALLFVALVALTGLPPTAGFVGKFLLFNVVVSSGIGAMQNGLFTTAALFYFALALLGVINSTVSLFYYMKIAKVMVFERTEKMFDSLGASDYIYALALTIPLLVLLDFTPLAELVHNVLSTSTQVMTAFVK